MSPALAREASDRMAIEAAVFSSAARAAPSAGASASAAGSSANGSTDDVVRAFMSGVAASRPSLRCRWAAARLSRGWVEGVVMASVVQGEVRESKV